jgi:hypothetical protein
LKLGVRVVRFIAATALATPVGTAGCSLLYDPAGFDAKYTDAGEAASPTMPLFHYRRLTKGSGDAAVSSLYPGVAFLLDSGAARPIGCEDKGSVQYFEPSLTVGRETLNNGPYRYGQFAMTSFHEPSAGLELPPGHSKFAFTQVIPNAGGSGYDYPLLVADELTDCDASRPAVRVDPVNQPSNAGKEHVLPRFSREGSRIAYLDLVAGPGSGGRRSVARVMTTGVDGDGMGPNVIRTPPLYDPTKNIVLWAMPPTWLPTGNEVAWLEGPDPSCSMPDCAWPPFEFHKATDTSNPTYGKLFTCPYGSGGFWQIAEFANFISENDLFYAIVASSGTLTAPAKGATDIYITDKGNLAYMGCSALVNATNLRRDGAVARDMAVSPDGSWIAYTANAAPIAGRADAGPPLDVTSPTHVWLLTPTVDGSANPIRCSDPTDSAQFDDFGPQWFDGGKVLVWTRAAHPPSVAPDAVGGLWQADVDLKTGVCSHVRPVVSNGPTDDGELTVIAPANATIACAMGIGRSRAATPAAGWGVVALVLAYGARWRARRREAAGSGRSRSGSIGSNSGRLLPRQRPLSPRF